MHAFKDTEGREWLLRVDIAAVKRVKALAGVDLLEIGKRGGEALAEVLGDLVKLADVLYVLCQPQAEARRVTDLDFGQALAGDVLDRAAEAFLGGLVDFFPERTRIALGKMLAAGRKVGEKLMAYAEAEAETLDPEAIAEREIARLKLLRETATPGATSGASPASPASTPTP